MIKQGDHVIPLYTAGESLCEAFWNFHADALQNVVNASSAKAERQIYAEKVHVVETLIRRSSKCPVRATQGKGLMPDSTSRFTCKGKPVHHFVSRL